MKVLIVGGGGREHALAWRIAQDSTHPTVICAPGNAGTSALGSNVAINATDIAGLLAWAKENRPDLTVVGPEAPLCAGLCDAFSAEGFPVFGPSKEAAQLEGSKLFAKEIMQEGGVPTAYAEAFTDVEEAHAYIERKGAPIVVKADGLAAGKGVTVCTSVEQAHGAIDEAMAERAFGDAGNRVLIEDCLEGEEASILALVDGEHIVMLDSSQDHKRALDGDRGPNTGGMGAYSPAPVVEEHWLPFIRERVLEGTLNALRKRGITYKGVLYAGLMMTEDGPSVLEFNCRFGDPETQAVLPRIDGDLLPALQACVDGTLSESLVQWKPEACACIVAASGGYPGAYEKDKEITGLNQADSRAGVTVFHAGTRAEDGKVLTSGGRVLGITGLGTTLREAVDTAYEALQDIHFEDMQYRKDIAWRALGGTDG
jgi:phosphoribosylamine--glycine ligase